MRVALSDVQRHLSLFAQGFAGRYLNFKISQAAAPQAAAIPADDIVVPSHIDDFASAQHNLGAYRVALLHQTGYLTQGTLTVDFAAPEFTPLMRRVFIAVEDLRIDAALMRLYPGALPDLTRVRAHALSQRPALEALAPPLRLIESLRRLSLGESQAQLLAFDGSLDEILEAAAFVSTPGAEVGDSVRAAQRICELILQRVGYVDFEDGSTFKSPQTDAEPQALSEAIAYRGELLLKRVHGAQRRGRSARTDGQSPEIQSGERLPGAAPAGSATWQRPAADPAPSPGVRSYLYDEWDYLPRRYQKHWCRVHELRLRSQDFDFMDGVLRRHARLLRHIRQQFARVKPEAWLRIHRTSDGDELDLSAVIDAQIERRAGYAVDSRLYTRRDRAQRDVAAAFLTDMSASTDILLTNPQPPAAAPPTFGTPATGLYLHAGQEDDAPRAQERPKRRVIDVEKDALALMCDALWRLGDSFAMYGFSGDGRDQVEFHIAKDFGDKVAPRTWAALAAMQPRRSTRMGAAIRHAAWKLKGQAARLKVLIILSDGYPEDSDYGPDRNDLEYGIHDTAQALKELQRAGVTYFCVTIDPSGHDYLQRMCAPSHYLVIDEVASLPQELTKIYRALTASASSRYYTGV